MNNIENAMVVLIQTGPSNKKTTLKEELPSLDLKT